MKAFFVRLLFLSFLLASAAQADSITTIQLHNRPADTVIPVIRPMLGPDEAISGQGFKLFLRSSPKNRAQVKQMIRSLDVAARMLLISVFQGSDRDLRALRVTGDFAVQDSNTHLGVSTGKHPEGGASAGFNSRNTSGDSTVISTRGRLQDNPIHRLRIIEGAKGYIETGKSIPYFSGTRWLAPGAVVGGIDYKDVTTGFYVRPRTHGDRVILEVSPFKQSQSNERGGDIDTRQAHTTITGQLGEWLPIGSTADQTQRSLSRIEGYSSTRSRNNESIWIRADLVK